MKLVEKHLIKASKPEWKEIDNLCFLSKNLYNCGIYECRQAFFKNQPVPNFKIKKQATYLGKRIKRGLFKASNGRVYNCDQNGSLNIIRNAVGDSVFDRQSITRLVVSPVRTKPYKAGLCHI